VLVVDSQAAGLTWVRVLVRPVGDTVEQWRHRTGWSRTAAAADWDCIQALHTQYNNRLNIRGALDQDVDPNPGTGWISSGF